MQMYIINLLIVMLFSPLCRCQVRRLNGQLMEGKKAYGLIVCGTFSCLMALRAPSVGVDTALYARIYTLIAHQAGLMEAIRYAPLTGPAYVLLCRILSHLSRNPQLMIVVSSLLIDVGLMKLVNRVSADAPVSYLAWIGLTLFYCSMNGTRQVMALILSLHALVRMSDSLRDAGAWMLFAVAVLTHPTALVLLFAMGGMLLADRIDDDRLLLLISGAASLLIAFEYRIGVKLIVRFVPRYAMYTAEGAAYSIFNGTGGGRIVYLYLVLLGLVMLWLVPARAGTPSRRGFIEKMLPAVLFGAIFGIVNRRNELINRLLWYYLGIDALFIPSVLARYEKLGRTVLTAAVVAVLLAYSMISLQENHNGVVPYRFFW